MGVRDRLRRLEKNAPKRCDNCRDQPEIFVAGSVRPEPQGCDQCGFEPMRVRIVRKREYGRL